MEFILKNRQMAIVGLVIVVLVGGGLLFSRGKSSDNNTQNAEEGLPTVALLPTVDSTVIVDLTADKLKREVTLSIEGVPNGTESIDYELSYLAEGNLPKGVIGTIDVTGKNSVEKDGITIGTCSSGACVYDKGVESIKVNLKFNGESGSQIFEKEFEI